MSRRCSFLISKLWLNYIKYSIENYQTKGAKLRKRERVFTFLAHKNQLPLFFLCTKYGTKVNIISREYDKRVQQSFLFGTKGANVKLQNGGMLGLDMSRNVSGISNPSLQQCCDGSFINFLLFTFSTLKKPAKEPKL